MRASVQASDVPKRRQFSKDFSVAAASRKSTCEPDTSDTGPPGCRPHRYRCQGLWCDPVIYDLVMMSSWLSVNLAGRWQATLAGHCGRPRPTGGRATPLHFSARQILSERDSVSIMLDFHNRRSLAFWVDLIADWDKWRKLLRLWLRGAYESKPEGPCRNIKVSKWPRKGHCGRLEAERCQAETRAQLNSHKELLNDKDGSTPRLLHCTLRQTCGFSILFHHPLSVHAKLINKYPTPFTC